jgi:hypothetical protein
MEFHGVSLFRGAPHVPALSEEAALPHHPITLLLMRSGRLASHLFPRCSFSTALKAIPSENE